MARLLLAPFLIVWCLLLPFAYGAWQIINHVQGHGTAAPGTYPADLQEQRRLADCYRVGCAETRPSSILSCAWRLVIAEETHDAAEAAEASKDCGGLREKDRQAAEKVKHTVLRALHIEPIKAHL